MSLTANQKKSDMLDRKIQWNGNEYTLFDKDFEVFSKVQLRALEIRTFIFNRSSSSQSSLAIFSSQNTPYIVVLLILVILFLAAYFTPWNKDNFAQFGEDDNKIDEKITHLEEKQEMQELRGD